MTPSKSSDRPVPVKIERPLVDNDRASGNLEPEFETAEIDRDKRQPELRKQLRWAWILGAILLIGGLGLSWRWWQSSRAQQAPSGAGGAGKPPATPVNLTTVASKTVQDSSVFVGTLQAPRSVTIKPQIEGRIKQLFITEGDRVQQGQPIVSLQSDDTQAVLQQRQAALAQANANLSLLKAGTRQEQIAQARATLAQAQAKLRDAQAGAQPQEIAQAVAQIDSAQSTLDLAKTRTQRYERLAQQGAVSQDQLEGFRQAQRSNQAALVVAQKKLAQLRSSRNSDISSLSAAVDQQQQNLQQQLNGARPEEIAQAQAQVAQAAAQVRAAQVQLQYTQVLAPFTGVVGNIPVKVGDLAAKGDSLTTLTKNDSFDLNLSIPLSRANQLRSGLPVELLDAAGKSIAMGKVGFIAPNATADSQTILAKANFAKFANSQGRPIDKQSVQARVIWQQRPGILIPVTAISRLGGKTFVFVAQERQSPDGKTALSAIQKPVELGAIEGNSYQVLQGLKPGEKIVTSGLLSLTNGAPIVVAPEQTASDRSKPVPN
jgi:RND family efflux transporter MFP subunit